MKRMSDKLVMQFNKFNFCELVLVFVRLLMYHVSSRFGHSHSHLLRLSFYLLFFLFYPLIRTHVHHVHSCEFGTCSVDCFGSHSLTSCVMSQ